MAEHYIEEYLVSLGFDLDSDTGKKYREMLSDLERQQNNFDKNQKKVESDINKADDVRKDSSKKRADNTKKEHDGLIDMEKTMRNIAVLSKQMGEGNMLGAFFSGAKGMKTLQEFFKNSEAPQKGESGLTTALKGGQVVKKASTFAESVESGKGIQAGVAQQQALQAGITGEAAGGAAGAAGMSSAVPVIGAVVAAVALLVKMTSSIEGMANNLASANISVESMAKKMWITDSAAWQLNNTLTAMGKTTADLNDIALNPTLRAQFNALQEYQNSSIQRPADLKETSDEWAKTVGEASQKLKATSAIVKDTFSNKMQKTFMKPIEGWFNFWNDTVKEIGIGLGADYGTKKTPTSTSALLNGANYAPNMSSYTTANASNLTVQNSPTVNVYPQSGDPNTIGSAVAGAVSSSFDDVALVKSIQGMSR